MAQTSVPATTYPRCRVLLRPAKCARRLRVKPAPGAVLVSRSSRRRAGRPQRSRAHRIRGCAALVERSITDHARNAPDSLPIRHAAEG
jgi:hypothetical protein